MSDISIFLLLCSLKIPASKDVVFSTRYSTLNLLITLSFNTEVGIDFLIPFSKLYFIKSSSSFVLTFENDNEYLKNIFLSISLFK